MLVEIQKHRSRRCRRSLVLSLAFLVADTQLYESPCPSVRPWVRWFVGPFVCRPSVHLSVHWSVMIECENANFRCCSCDCLCVRVYVGWARVWMGVTRPCPPVSNDIVTPRHLFLSFFGGRFASNPGTAALLPPSLGFWE